MELRSPTLEELRLLLELADRSFHSIRPSIDPHTMQVSERYIELQNALSNIQKFLADQSKSKLNANKGLLDNLVYGNGNILEDSIADEAVRVKHQVAEFQNTKALNAWFNEMPSTHRVLQIIPNKVNIGTFSETTLYTVHYAILEDKGLGISEEKLRQIFGEQE